MKLCASHSIDELVPMNFGHGVVYLCCDKCPWHEPPPPNNTKVRVTVYNADGSIYSDTET